MTLPGGAIHVDCYMLSIQLTSGEEGDESESLWLKVRVGIFFEAIDAKLMF